jgi:hypothetical protein
MSYLPYLCLFVQYIVVVSTLFVGGHMSCLPYLCLFVHVYSGGIYFVCRRAHVLFTLFVFVCTCILVVVSTLFVGGHMSCLPYLCLFVHVYSGGIYFVCRMAHVSFTLFVFVCTCI